ncbi:MAG: helix-turn-helix transcriptional regulator [Bacteriovoracaceae bacterium]
MRNFIVLLLFTVFFVTDILHDLHQGISLSHILHEVILFLISLAALIWQVRVIFIKNKSLHALNVELLETKKSYQEWKQRTHSQAMEIRRMIDEQFAVWHLSQSEKDVALLLIKGLSMKEIAEIRATHEKTVRQQATTIYKKAGLSGRQELAAFFFEDILSLPLTQN